MNFKFSPETLDAYFPSDIRRGQVSYVQCAPLLVPVVLRQTYTPTKTVRSRQLDLTHHSMLWLCLLL